MVSVTCLVLYGAYCIALVSAAPTLSIAVRWFQNDPALHWSHLALLPVSFGLLGFAVARTWINPAFSAGARRGLGALLALCLGMSMAALQQDLGEWPLRVWMPLEIARSDARYAMTEEHHRLMQEPLKEEADCSPYVDQSQCPVAEILATNAKRRVEIYQQRLKTELGITNIAQVSVSRDGNWVAVLSRVLSGVAALWAALYFAFTLFAVIGERRMSGLILDDARDALVLALAVMTFWFPLRLYSNWYIWLGTNPASASITVLAMALPLGVFLNILLLVPTRPVAYFGAVASTVPTGFTLANALLGEPLRPFVGFARLDLVMSGTILFLAVGTMLTCVWHLCAPSAVAAKESS